MERVSNRAWIAGFVRVIWVLLTLAACQRAFDNPWDPLNRRIRSVQLLDVQQGNGISRIADTTTLILQFDVDPVTLTADHITLTGASKGTLTDQGATKILAISNLTVSDGATVEVQVTSPSGFQISGSPKTVVYRQPVVGMPYGGGIVAYIYQTGDPGYVAGEVHGLIASVNDLSSGIKSYDVTPVTTGASGTALGTGLSNTNRSSLYGTRVPSPQRSATTTSTPIQEPGCTTIGSSPPGMSSPNFMTTKSPSGTSLTPTTGPPPRRAPILPHERVFTIFSQV